MAAKFRALALALMAMLVGTVSACTFQPDPTENNFDVKILNDTSRPVVLSYCGTGHNLCNGKLYDSGTLQPGGEWTTVQTSIGLSDPWLVQSVSRKRLGCLPVSFDYNASGAVVRVSHVVRCQPHYPALSKPGQ